MKKIRVGRVPCTSDLICLKNVWMTCSSDDVLTRGACERELKEEVVSHHQNTGIQGRAIRLTSDRDASRDVIGLDIQSR